jgi:HD-GYP domain-containing protein (c-di-GMP phosphodiesterase class II)
VLAETIEKKDPYTGGHIQRVVGYSQLLGRQLGLDRQTMEDLRLAATLHDIGKNVVPDRILGKPAKLDPAEAETMKRHTIDGAEIVSPLANPRVLSGVRSHHERLDGRGYPDGLADGDIPLEPRIIAVADTFDAMTTNRPYQSAMEQDYALERIRSLAGTKFDPRIVSAIESAIASGKIRLTATLVEV